MKIISDSKIPFAREAFGQFGDVVLLDTPDITSAAVTDTEILLVRSETRVDRTLLAESKVRFVGTATIGTDHVDTDYLAAQGIMFSSAPGCNANSVAEYVVAALLELSRRHEFSLQGRSVGVVGVGNIGSKVVQYAEAIGMKVLRNDPPRARQSGLAQFLPLDELMDCDILTLHVPLIREGPDATYHLFDRARISRMKEGSILINTSRGAVVETGALLEALQSKHLGACVLDVWEGEPRIDVNLLSKVDLGTPHISGYSFDGKVNGTRMVYAALCRFIGLRASWDLQESASSRRNLSISDNKIGLEPFLQDAVRQCYDIERDDSSLRGILARSESERGIFFQGLRAKYPLRREFFKFNVLLNSSKHDRGEILKRLGFVVEYGDTGIA